MPGDEETEQCENVGVDAVCQICKDGGRDEFMLLCEACDVGYHYDCLTPPLKGIPDEAWFCKGCLEKFGDAGPPAWTAFGPGDRCVATFEEDKTPGSQAKWVCKVLDIQGTTALVHFPGWKDKHDLWVERSTLEELPAEEVLARAQRSRLLTEAEEQKRLQDIEKERQAQEVVETEIKMGELEGEKKKLHKLIQAEKAKVKPSTGTAMATASNKASKAGSGGGEGRKGALAEGGVKEQEEEGDSGGRKGSEELAKLLARLKDVGEQIKDLRRSLPRKHESYLPPVNATGDQGERSNGGKRGRGGKEGAGPGVAPGFASRVTTLDDEGGDGWNDYCLECGSGEGELICCDACPRAFCLACARLAKAPRGNWFCKPCTNAKQMLATGGGIGSDKLLLQIQRLCEQFPMTHFLGLLAFDLARVRTSAEYCRELGISLNGMHEVATAKEALEKLDSLLEAANAQDSAGETKGEGSGARAGAEGCSSDVSEARSAPAPGPASTRGAAAAEKRGKDGVGQGSDALGGAGQAGKASSGAGDGGRAVRAGATGGSGSKKHQAASAMSGMALADARYKKFEEVVTRFYQDGVCVPDIGLTEGQVEACKEAVERYYNDVKFTIQQKQLQSELEAHGWETFKLRCPGRYDMQVPDLDLDSFKFLREDAPWMDAVHAILGSDCKLHYMGCMLSQPQSACQQWHSDGDHLSEDEHLPAYAVNVFVPLVDMDASLGPTEFVPTTHLLFNYDPMEKIEPVTFCTRAGQCLLFDYRVKHRGLGNRASISRPMIYITYGTKAWSDKDNFNRKRFPKLPELVKQRAPRSELPSNWRERKRMREEEEALQRSKAEAGGSLCGSPTKPVKKDKKSDKSNKVAASKAL